MTPRQGVTETVGSTATAGWGLLCDDDDDEMQITRTAEFREGVVWCRLRWGEKAYKPGRGGSLKNEFKLELDRVGHPQAVRDRQEGRGVGKQ